jgi:hypothetical protein
MFGRVLIAYGVTPAAPPTRTARATGGGPASTMLRCDLFVPGASPGPRQTALMWGDLVMMRKQLLTWKSLAESQAASAG